ncbi:hypothetical protein EZS27_034989 [termite gut metagenome]|uniref:Tc1-like transposase DDE domain-containing protein n=1 Tax=termite gut metagenome TaxID=433724 RepID=A0A5J4Q079_9ZZZZ
MVMDGAAWHRGDKLKKWENIVPLFQPAYSPEVNPIESLWHHIREKGKFKNTTFHSNQCFKPSFIVSCGEIQEYYVSQPGGGRKQAG